MYRVCIVSKPAIIQQRLRAKFNSVHQEYNLVGILGSCNQLSRFEAGQCFSGTGGVPDVAAHLILISPATHGNAACNTRSRIILIAAHNLQNAVSIIGNGIETDQLVRHRDGKQILCNVLPVVQRLVVGVRPVEVKVFVELSVRAGVGKIDCFIRLHGNKNLHKGKQSGENTLVCIFFNLVIGLADIHTAAFQFTVNRRHTVDQQHKITTAVGQNRVPCLKHRLFGNLIAALTGGDFLTVIDFQTDFLTEVQFVRGIVALDSNRFTVDKTVEFQRRAQTGNLIKNLPHFAVGQRNIVQPVHIPVVFKENLFPVLDQLLFRFVA